MSNEFDLFIYETDEYFPTIQSLMNQYGSGRQAIRNALMCRTNTWHGWHLVPYEKSRRDRYTRYFPTKWSSEPDKKDWRTFLNDYRNGVHDEAFNDKYAITTNEQLVTLYHMAREEEKFFNANESRDLYFTLPYPSFSAIGRIIGLDSRTVAGYIRNFDKIELDNKLMHGII